MTVMLLHAGCGVDTTGSNNGIQSATYQNPYPPKIPDGMGGRAGPDGRPINNYNPVSIPLHAPSGRVCSTGGMSMYSWGYEVWNGAKSPLVDFLRNPKVQDFGCGDIYINVADYTATTYIRDEFALVSFIRNVRASGNRGIVFLVYGDVQVSSNGAPNGPTEFADTFFGWLEKVPDTDLGAMLPIGLSYDCEHLSHTTIENALNRAQQLKADFAARRLGGDASKITIEWTIEGQEKPVDTDIVMKLSDRALMMAYRNHVGTSVRDPTGVDNIITRIFDFMFTNQCRHCLDDAYATANYKAKIKLMFEADCQCGSSCNKISFCAYDAVEALWGGNSYKTGAQYLVGTLKKAEELIRARLGPAKFQRLFGHAENMSLFVIHNWNWFTCYFDDPSVAITTPIGSHQSTCKDYHTYAKSCRSQ